MLNEHFFHFQYSSKLKKLFIDQKKAVTIFFGASPIRQTNTTVNWTPELPIVQSGTDGLSIRAVVVFTKADNLGDPVKVLKSACR